MNQGTEGSTAQTAALLPPYLLGGPQLEPPTSQLLAVSTATLFRLTLDGAEHLDERQSQPTHHPDVSRRILMLLLLHQRLNPGVLYHWATSPALVVILIF